MKNEIRRWMLVDDTPAILEAVAMLLETLDFAEIHRFNSGRDALEAFQENPDAYELVISDLDMPEMNGFELCENIRTISFHQKILLATGSSEVTEAEAMQHGFCGLLKKPFPVSALLNALETAGIFRSRDQTENQGGIEMLSPAWA